MANDTARPKTDKVEKPSPAFPLTPHRASRQWCKKVRGRTYYFGSLNDPDKALDRWLREKDYLLAGRVRPPDADPDGLTIHEMVNRFLESKRNKMETGELHEHTFYDYHRSARTLLEVFGKKRRVADLAPGDFAVLRRHLARDSSIVTLNNRIGRISVIFNWAVDNDLIQKVRMGTEFQRPSKKVLRVAKSKKPTRLFTVQEVRQLVARAGTRKAEDDTPSPEPKIGNIQLKAMVLLGINCALGNADLANLRREHLDLDAGWLNYPRGKTGVDRRAKLWPQTVAALQAVLAKPRKPKDPADQGLVFVTRLKLPYIRFTYNMQTGKQTTKDSIAMEFSKLLTSLGIERDGVGFYSLRHTFRTVVDNLVADQRAIDMIMGHQRGDISEDYTHLVNDERLARIADALQAWLFPAGKKEDAR